MTSQTRIFPCLSSPYSLRLQPGIHGFNHAFHLERFTDPVIQGHQLVFDVFSRGAVSLVILSIGLELADAVDSVWQVRFCIIPSRLSVDDLAVLPNERVGMKPAESPLRETFALATPAELVEGVRSVHMLDSVTIEYDLQAMAAEPIA